ncbi:MAG: CopG family transcriptional regulator [Hyphomonadaceae bacterium]|nr:CopG family transcriptional regulator [Hyphomonadaceae bacterium]
MTREPKKTEMLEIRVSSETKFALQAKARADGKSVSEVLRQLIAHYLGPQTPVPQRRRTIMRLSSFAAGVAALALTAIALTPPANAGGMLLGLSALIDMPGMSSTQGRRIIETSIELDYGREVLLCVPAEGEATAELRAATTERCGFDSASGYAILLSANAAPDDRVLIRPHVLTEGETSMPESASAFLVKLDSWAAMQTQSEQGAQTMRLTFFPRRL